jgi:hypothetical protein
MPRKEKLGNTRGVSEWRELETTGDARRFLAWLIHSVRDQNLDPKTAAVLANICNILIGAIRDDDLQARIEKVEAWINAIQSSQKN